MVMNMQTISSDLVVFIGKLLSEEEIIFLVGNDHIRPFEQAKKSVGSLAPFGSDQRLYPYPFNVDYNEGMRSQIHLYFPTMDFNSNDIVEDIIIWFDIVVHKELWLIEKQNTEGRYEKLIRPYEIAQSISEIVKRVDVGDRDLKVDLVSFDHLGVNENYQAIRLEGRLVNWQ
jgi:hypothetical protein